MRRLVLSCLLACASTPSAAAAGPSDTSGEAPETQAKAQAPKRPLVVIDPGHGGKDGGARAAGRDEADLVLQIARKVRDHLERTLGMRARMTRDGDDFISLDDRVRTADEGGAEAFISIHIDKAARRRSRGVTAYVYGRSRRSPRRAQADAPPRSQVAESCRLATSIRRGLLKRGLRTARFVDRARFAVLKSPEVPSVLLEVGNLKDKRETARLADPAFQERLAASIARGVAGFLKEQERLASR